ncbi:MAG: molybdopterin-synthase adenylyltransferase MoeB [Deltaproteobacteria bacterium]|nr:MAG: molybdopterin-synthase adenylyltransferase MoeB [Deltaproteobacteria bacterium]
MSTFQELIKKVKSEIKEIRPSEAREMTQKNNQIVMVDVREADEWEGGIAPGALTIQRGFLELDIEDSITDKNTPVIAYCAGGTRSAFAAKTLQDMGYKTVYSMSGGFNGWKDAGLPIFHKRSLSKEQSVRYSRHTLLPEVGEEGQLKLLDAKVLLIGAGGLGCPTGLYLAAAGVGTLGIIDYDGVDLSNLQRQILHSEEEVGNPKVESAQRRLNSLNSDIKIIPIREKLSRDNVMKIVADYDIVVNGCDNFPTRYLINDVCVFMKKPLVDGSIFRFEGQVTIFDSAKGGPCYRCLYPEPPPPEMAPSCAEGGVLGVLPGIIGSIEAVETIKIILGKGEPLIGRLMMYDALGERFREMKIRRDPACPVCGDNPTIKELIDYEWFCSNPN